MTEVVSVKTNFTAGQISENLFGRGDLGVYENGARCLKNVIIHPTGGISRRQGLELIEEISGKAKLIPFEFNAEQNYLLCLLNYKMRVYFEGEFITEIDTPWGEEHLPKLNWTQSADTLLVVHPDVEPRKVTRNIGEVWKIEPWEYYEEKNGMVYCPYFNFSQSSVVLNLSGESGIVNVVASKDVFCEEHVGLKFRVKTGMIEIDSFTDSRHVKAKIVKFTNTTETTDWGEQAFSELRGWPCSVTFHQGRLVIGGSRSLPNRLWFSTTSDLFNFNFGTGLDDQAIEFAILSDQVNAICNVISSRHLLVFTTGSEWMVSSAVLTPTSIQLDRQTNIGSYNKYAIPVQQVNGANLFLSYSGKQIREFLFTDVEQAYSAKDLSLLSKDIVSAPVFACFNKDTNVMFVLLEDGTISCLTTYRTEEVNAWSRLETNGKFLSVGIVGDDTYFVVYRGGRYFIEKFDDEFYADCAVKLYSESPRSEWSGLDIMEGQEVVVVSEDFYIGKYLVENGTIKLFEELKEVRVGLPYEHVVEPLPYMVDSARPFPPKAIRTVDTTFRVVDTRGLSVDLGKGYFNVPLKRMFRDKILDAPPMDFSGDVELKSLRWVRNMEQPAWSVRSDIPLPFNLLSVVMRLKLKN